MMLQVMAYTVLVTAALTVVGHCLERWARLQRTSRRTGWVAAMVLSVLLPTVMILVSRVKAPLVTSPNSSTLVHVQGELSAAVDQEAIWKLALPSDNQLLAMWLVASLIFALYLIGVTLLLRLRATRWSRATLVGREVLISEATGPALLGVLNPRIVVPRWLFGQPDTAKKLILEHEHQHMDARDPLLMMVGLLIIVAVPWNLPLWWQWRRMRQAMELDCDARVLATGAEADVYADVLLEVARRMAWVYPGALAMSEPATALERRIDELDPRPTKHVVMQAAALVGFAAAGIGAALALNAPAIRVPTKPSTTVLAQRVALPEPLAPTPSGGELPGTAPAAGISRAGSQRNSKGGSSRRSADGKVDMNKPASIALAVAAVSTAAFAQAQTPASAPPRDNVQRATAVQDFARAAEGRQASTAQIMANNDLNKDGVVTIEEATRAGRALILMWSFYDKDHNGTVTAQEIEQATTAMEVATAEEKIAGQRSRGPAKMKPEQIIALNDLNGDGIVTKEEAMKMGVGLDRLWQLYDLDKDGKVDVAEVAKAENY